MTEEYWIAILKEEDRLIDNSDRKYRYHCKSLESMSEELTFQERYIGMEQDFTILCEIQDFIDLVQNEELAAGLRRLTDRQRQAIRLRFWEGYQCQEIAAMFGCSPAAVTNLMRRAFKQLRIYLMKQSRDCKAAASFQDCNRLSFQKRIKK